MTWLLLFAVCGFVFGLKVSLIIQAIVFVAWYLYMNSENVRGMELGALLPLAIGFYFFAGVVVGDIYYFIAFSDVKLDANWFFRP